MTMTNEQKCIVVMYKMLDEIVEKDKKHCLNSGKGVYKKAFNI